MSVMKEFIPFGEEYKQYSTVNGQANPAATTHQQMQKLFGNWSDILQSLVAGMWQPNTAYEANQIVRTPSMPVDMIAVCTASGTSGASEPTWPILVNGTVVDGGAQWKMYAVTNGNPVGTIIAYAANGSIPEGYLPCNGAAVSRATYAALFEVIGTLYGEGDGSTTFNLPNLTDRFLEGSSTAGNKLEAGLPNIIGNLYGRFLSGNGYSIWVDGRLFYNVSTVSPDSQNSATQPNNSNTGHCSVGFEASRSNSIYGNSTTVQPSALTTSYLIKY